VATLTNVERFQRLFRGRETAHGQFDPLRTEAKKGWTISKPTPDEAWTRHLSGGIPWLGIIPHQLDNTTYWGAVDVDDETVNHASVAAMVEHAGLPLVVCRSRSGKAHLFLFLAEPVPNKLVRTKLRAWHLALGFRNNPDGRPIEVFPKADRLEVTQQGNWISLPYWGALGGKVDRVAVEADGNPLTFEQFLNHAEERRLSRLELEATEAGGGLYPEGPPCLNTLLGLGFPSGSRNMGLVNLGIMVKATVAEQRRLAEEAQEPSPYDLAWFTNELKTIARDHFDPDPPMSDREVESTAKSVWNREYSYKCDEQPIQPHCDKKVCRTRKFGVGVIRQQKLDAAMPPLSDLRKLMTTPPRWILNVATRDVELSTEELMNIPRFRKAVLERCDRIFPLLKQFECDDMLRPLLDTKTVIDAPEDAGVDGQFRALFEQFLLRRAHAASLDDLKSGVPYEKNGMVYFRSGDLMRFLARSRFHISGANEVYALLRRLNVSHTILGEQGDGVRVWAVKVPTDAHLLNGHTPKLVEEPLY
jgi:hypothetical protein